MSDEDIPQEKVSVWKFYKIIDHSQAKCKFCSTIISYRKNIETLKIHLLTNHDDLSLPLLSIKNKEQIKPKIYAAESYKKSRGFIWNFFTKVDDEEYTAECDYCNDRYRFMSSTGNLTTHLKKKHPDVYINEFMNPSRVEQSRIKGLDQLIYDTTPKRSVQWDHFVKLGDYVAECNTCKAKISYRSGTSNLTKHYNRKHLDQGSEPQTDNDEEESDHSAKSSLWTYFEKMVGHQARCVVCCATVSRSSMKAHLRDKHPKLVSSLDDDSGDETLEYLREQVHGPDRSDYDVISHDNDGETKYTEIIYLDDNLGSAEDDAYATTETSKKEKTPLIKNKRRESKTYYEEKSAKRPKMEYKMADDNEIDDELKNFLLYIQSLLRNMQKDVCAKLQLDIVNLIMSVKLKLSLSPDKQSVDNDKSYIENKIVYERIPVTVQNIPNAGTYLVVEDSSQRSDQIENKSELQDKQAQTIILNKIDEEAPPPLVNIAKRELSNVQLSTIRSSEQDSTNSQGSNNLIMATINVPENHKDSGLRFHNVSKNVTGVRPSRESTGIVKVRIANSVGTAGTVTNSSVQGLQGTSSDTSAKGTNTSAGVPADTAPNITKQKSLPTI